MSSDTRKVSKRIITGIIADASIGPFYKVSHDSTFKRLGSGNGEDEDAHPYTRLWSWINTFTKLLDSFCWN